MEVRGPLGVLLPVVLGIAVIGFFSGTAPKEYDMEQPAEVPHVEHPEDIPQARTYRELRDSPRGNGSGWSEGVAAANSAMPAIVDAVELVDTAKDDALAHRAARRAYDGAPPTIPHKIRQGSAAECLACHEDGLRMGQRRAPMRPHDAYTSCTQCHVTAVTPMPGGYDLEVDPRNVANSFDGLPSPVMGPRAWDIAPPEIPHTSQMRERCHSCHGVNGRDAIRSSHPWRQSCTQCHAPNAEKDRRLGL